MKKTVISLLLVVLLCFGVAEPALSAKNAQPIAAPSVEHALAQELYYTDTPQEHIAALGSSLGYADNELIVYFKDSATEKQKQSVFDALDAKVIGHTGILNKYQLQLPEKKSFAALLALCAKAKLHSKVAFASCNLAQQLKEDVVPDDPWTDKDGYYVARSWDEKNISGGNWWLKAIQAPSAWENADKFNPIRVGILDSGFEVDHEDLQGKISFSSSKSEKTNYPDSHGTHVAGIISANANNKIGVTGICDNAELICADWNPEQSIGQSWSSNERIFTGFISLVLSGAKVINMSFGSSGGYSGSESFSWKFTMFMEGMLFSYTMAKLLNLGYDFIAVQSAGNGDRTGTPVDSYYNGTFCSVTKRNAFPGLGRTRKQDILDRIIVVGSSTSAHTNDTFYQSSFSNYGKGVSIFAPGSSVFSTVLKEEGNYDYKSGTSMAAPNAAAVTALTWSVNPKLTGAQVKKIVCDPENTIYTVENRYNEEIDIPSYPMINANLSVQAAIKTLGLPEETTTEEPVSDPTEEESTDQFEPHDHTVVQMQEEPFLKDSSDEKTIEKFRGEIGE